VTSTIPTGTWLGTTTDWNSASNWCGGVPTSTTDITLPSTGTLPAITGTTATCRNLTIPSGITLNIGSGANFNLAGNLSGLGNIAGVSGSSLTLNGTTAQTIQRVNVGTLVVNNGAGVTLGSNVTLSNGVTLTNGILNTGNNNLILLSTASSPTETANSYIIGNIRSTARMIGTGSGSMFGITIAAGTDNLDTVMIERGENAATYNGNEGIGHIWKIRAGNQPVSGRQITLSWNARADNGKDITRLQVYRRPDTGGEWIRMGGIVNGSSRSITLTTNSFSDWTVSDQDAPLPVTLTSFTGKSTLFGNQLNWITSSEVNNQGFNVERSTDGRTFTKIGFVKGNGTTNIKQTYQFTDVNSSEAYYRLQQVDFDGKSEYSATIKVGESSLTTQLDIFPNPAKDQVTIRTIGEGTIEIVSLVGQVVITQPANGTNEINISKLAMGVYTVKFNGVS
ncbi:MAG: T9SS type A sorting domain-containing protein, partial [Flexibacteraceae bacterium]